jgi:hypothetical protein
MNQTPLHHRPHSRQRWLKARSACPLCNKVRRVWIVWDLGYTPCRVIERTKHKHNTTTQQRAQEWEFAKIEKILAGGAMAVD